MVLAPFVAPQPQWSSDDVLRFVHIGKCGGTTIDHWLRSVKDKFIGTAASGYESYHMNQLYMESPYAGHSNFVVWVRDPIDRFQSPHTTGSCQSSTRPYRTHSRRAGAANWGPGAPHRNTPGIRRRRATRTHTAKAQLMRR